MADQRDPLLTASVATRRVRALAAQPPAFAERVRATVLSWSSTEAWFDEVMHAPGPHSHPGATEVFVVLEGAFELAVGPTTFTMTRGEMCLIPPDVVHDPVGTAGTDLALLSVVSPNRKGLRSAMSDVPASACPGTSPRGMVRHGALPSNEQLDCHAYSLAEGERTAWEGRRDVDRVLVVVDGEVDVEVGPLRGRLTAGSMSFVPARAAHAIVGRGDKPATVLAVWGTGVDG